MVYVLKPLSAQKRETKMYWCCSKNNESEWTRTTSTRKWNWNLKIKKNEIETNDEHKKKHTFNIHIWNMCGSESEIRKKKLNQHVLFHANLAKHVIHSMFTYNMLNFIVHSVQIFFFVARTRFTYIFCCCLRFQKRNFRKMNHIESSLSVFFWKKLYCVSLNNCVIYEKEMKEPTQLI